MGKRIIFGVAVIGSLLWLAPVGMLSFSLHIAPRHGPSPSEDVPASTSKAQGQSVTLLPDGHLLLLGGEGSSGPLSTAEILDPSTGKASVLSTSLNIPRSWHTATLLPSGTVLIFGGISSDGHVVTTAESFDPSTQSFTVLPALSLMPRAHHTVTVLTNGLLFVAGGMDSEGETIGTAQLWDFQTNTTTDIPSEMVTPRRNHSAKLLGDGTVLLWGGVSASGENIPDGEIFDPQSGSFRIATAIPPAGGSLRVAATIPEDNSDSVPVDTLISMRFSQPIDVRSATVNTVGLSNSQGAVSIRVVPVEAGILVFVNPVASLAEGATYTVTTSGVMDPSGNPVDQASFSFTTEKAPNAGGSGTSGGAAGGPTGSQGPPKQNPPPLQAPPGITALSGRSLIIDGRPLAGLTLKIGNQSTTTDASGRFLLENVPAGHSVLTIDGRTATVQNQVFGVFEDGVDITAGSTNVLKYTIWMTPLDTKDAVPVKFPTTSEVVVTNPLLPGLEFQIPPNTTIYDSDWNVAKQISITPIPVDKPPFPLPARAKVPIYFTIQPGGGWIEVSGDSGAKGGRLFYPNTYNSPPATIYTFWNYDAKNKGWYIYGHGSVTSDRKSVVPFPGVVIYRLTGAMVSQPTNAPPNGPCPGCPQDGEPVDLGTGLFIYNKTDLSVSDVIPLTLTRTYRQGDSVSRAFGIGTTHNYDIFLIGDNNTFPEGYTYQDLILPDGSRIHFVRTSPCESNGYCDFSNAAYVANSAPGTSYFGATIQFNLNDYWVLTKKDGTVMTFPDSDADTVPQEAAIIGLTDRNGNTLTFTRDSSSNLTSVTSPNGLWIQFTYDSNNRVTAAQDNIGRTVQYSYDSGGRLSQVTDANGGVWKYAYDSTNEMTSITDPRNITYLQNQYDSNGRVASQTLADGGSYVFRYYLDQYGNVQQTDVRDPREITNRHVFFPPPSFLSGTGTGVGLIFSSGGYSSQDIYALGTPEQESLSYQRQDGTNLLSSVTDTLGRTTSYTYDSMGNLTSVTKLSGTSNAVTATFTYDPKFNQITSVTDPLGHTNSFGYDSSGNMISVTDSLGNTSTMSYNSSGEMVSATDPLNETTGFTYAGGDLTAITDPLNRTTKLSYDGAGRLISTVDPLGDTTKTSYTPLNEIAQIVDARGGVTALTYDPNGNLLSVTDPRNTSNPTTFTYDSMDRVATRTDPLNRTESYQYDGDGNLTQFTDRRGEVTNYTYDNLNRRTFAGFNTNPGPTYDSTITYAYDDGDRLTQAVDSTTGTITRTYDGLDRLTSETTPQGSVSYGYDAANRRTSMSVSNQAQVVYSYDSANRMTQITQGTSTVSFSYDSTNRRTSLTLPNGVTMSYGYDSASELTGINYMLGPNSLGNLGYTYDIAGHRNSVSGSMAAVNLPNPISTTAYDAANELTQWGTATPTYDADGNMLSDGTNTYVWDSRNHLASMDSGADTFEYGPFGRRVGKIAILGTTNYLYDGMNPVQELSGAIPTANLLTGGIDEYFQRTDSSGTASFLTDALGSTIELTDSSGNNITQYAYEPFGNTTATGTSTNPYQFTGRENDGNGLYFFRARYYNPALQRFLSEDPIGAVRSGSNLYSYVANDPISFGDPSGQSLSWIHYRETYDAVMAVYGNRVLAMELALAVADVDQGTQGTSWRDTRIHAMAGRKDDSNQTPQTCQQAYDSTSDFVRQESEIPSSGGAGPAIHAIQDSYASGHQYQFWPGGRPSWAHIEGDSKYLPEAEQATEKYLRTNGSLQPSNYLYPDPCK